MTLLKNTEADPGQTGKFSPGKIIGCFVGLVTCYISVDYFWLQKVGLSNNEWLLGTFVTGVLSIGFYAGMGKGLFAKLGDALVERVKGK